MKIVFLDEYSVGGADLSAIISQGEYAAYEMTNTTSEIVERCQEAEVVIVNKVVLSREVMIVLPNLRLICVAATGMNNVDLEAAAELGIEVRNAIGYSTNSVAEATIASALSLTREISYYDRYIKSGDYSLADRLFCFDRNIGELYGQNWGIIGLGSIGRRVAELAMAFGCQVRYYSTSGAVREECVDRVKHLDELLQWSDILSIHAPLNAATADLIGERELSIMRPNALLINVARGGIVDESSLAKSLNEKVIRGAAFDVFINEPIDPLSPLLTINDPDRLRLSPHNAWQSVASVARLVAAIAANIKRYRERRLATVSIK